MGIERKDKGVAISLMNLAHRVIRSRGDFKPKRRTTRGEYDILERLHLWPSKQHQHATIFVAPAPIQLNKKAMGFTIRPCIVMNSNFLCSIELVCGDVNLGLDGGACRRCK